jgi:two-component sensor histidine kinase
MAISIESLQIRGNHNLLKSLSPFPTGLSEDGDKYVLTWKERGGPPSAHPEVEGFGRILERSTVNWQLGGEISRDWQPDGLTIRLAVPRARL